MLGGIPERAEDRRGLAALGYRDECIAGSNIEGRSLAATALGVVLEELHGTDEREVAARHDGRRAVCESPFLARQLGGAAVEEVPPHRLEEDGEATRRAAAREDDAPLRPGHSADHGIHELGEAPAREDVAHRDRHLPITALQTLYAGNRRPPEVLLQRRGDRIRLLRRQESELELLLVVNEIAGLRPCALANLHHSTPLDFEMPSL